MPSIMLRDLPTDLVGRLRAYAHERDLRLPAAARELLTAALDARDARRRGAQARWQGTTPEDRHAMTAPGRAAALARAQRS